MPANTSIPTDCTLRDGRLWLRTWSEGDADALYAAARESIASVGRWLPWCNQNYAHDDAVAWVAHCRAGWKRQEHYAFAIFDATRDELLGGVGLSQRIPQHRSANLGYWVKSSRHRQGIASAAARLITAFGFGSLQLARIEIVAAKENQASRRTAEKIGAVFETIARNRLVLHDRPIDAAVYSLIPSDPF